MMYCSLPYSTKVLTLVYALSLLSAAHSQLGSIRAECQMRKRSDRNRRGSAAPPDRRGGRGGGVKLISVAGLGGDALGRVPGSVRCDG